jgi:hypothetical protein
MTNDELDRSLRQLRLGGMADALSDRSKPAPTAWDRWISSVYWFTTSCSDAATGLSNGASRPPAFAISEPSMLLTGRSIRSIEP